MNVANGPTQCQPSSGSERYPTIDIIRGLALFGVLIVNILSDFRIPLLEYIFAPYADRTPINRLVEVSVAGFLEFKALTIFSFLFGVGIEIQVDRRVRRGAHPRRFLIRRLGCLLLMGTVHLLFIWNGDILTLYAVCGLLLLPPLELPWPALLAIAVTLIMLPEFVSFGLSLPSGT